MPIFFSISTLKPRVARNCKIGVQNRAPGKKTNVGLRKKTIAKVLGHTIHILTVYIIRIYKFTLNSAFPSSTALLPVFKQLINFQEESLEQPRCLAKTLLVFWAISHERIKAQSATAAPLYKNRQRLMT